MKRFDDDTLKLMALEYADKNKIVNKKTIDCYIHAVRTAENYFTHNFAIRTIANDWNRDQKEIDKIATQCHYGGYYDGIMNVENCERRRLAIEKKLALACAEYLEELTDLNKEKKKLGIK